MKLLPRHRGQEKCITLNLHFIALLKTLTITLNHDNPSQIYLQFIHVITLCDMSIFFCDRLFHFFKCMCILFPFFKYSLPGE